jgi:hypothetical protein
MGSVFNFRSDGLGYYTNGARHLKYCVETDLKRSCKLSWRVRMGHLTIKYLVTVRIFQLLADGFNIHNICTIRSYSRNGNEYCCYYYYYNY